MSRKQILTMLSSTTTAATFTSMALVVFLIVQSYVIGNRNNAIDKMILGSLIPTVLLGNTFALFSGRAEGRAVFLKALAFMSALTFLIMESYMINRIDYHIHRTMLGSLYVPVLAGYTLAYYTGRSIAHVK